MAKMEQKMKIDVQKQLESVKAEYKKTLAEEIKKLEEKISPSSTI